MDGAEIETRGKHAFTNSYISHAALHSHNIKHIWTLYTFHTFVYSKNSAMTSGVRIQLDTPR